jgi:hypothetical protein
VTRWRTFSLEAIVIAYCIIYIPNVMVLRIATSGVHPALGRPLTGLETLPSSLILNLLMTIAFIWWAGWGRDAHQVKLGSYSLPCPKGLTWLSSLGSALILLSVPLSYTIQGVSIPFMQLLMRGDVLVIAPMLDLIFGRKVHWWSWAALVMVLIALYITLYDRGGLNLPPLAILTVVIYTLGYFLRLFVMNRISKNGDPAMVRRYFVEEKVGGLPIAITILALISISGIGGQSTELSWGFVQVWLDPVLWPMIIAAGTLTIISVISILILLDPRENAFCVPLERASSLVAGVVASVILALGWGLKMPRPAEFAGAAVLIAAITLLSVAPRMFGAKKEVV